ncbi:MAG: NUDIX hydrolase [Lachnospiraceae bacterium]|nr:NUDIX hydrolase [Lachnospiraceae bacterium]MBQ4068156.1 NUDIX hydrolase [Lachnospiraceae bacterium]
MMEKFERIKRELVYKGAIIDMYKDYVQIPNGNVAEWDFIKHKGAAAALPVTEDGKILLVKQYRNALDRETIEIPAGGLDNEHEPMIECASRELEEETGYKSDDLEFLISIKTTVAFCNERIDVFVAKNLKKSQQNLDEDEYVDVVEYEPETLVQMIYDGVIQDSKTVSAILAYYNKYCKE